MYEDQHKYQMVKIESTPQEIDFFYVRFELLSFCFDWAHVQVFNSWRAEFTPREFLQQPQQYYIVKIDSKINSCL